MTTAGKYPAAINKLHAEITTMSIESQAIGLRVRAGLKNAQANGKRLGRPRRVVDSAKVRALRESGESWRSISNTLGVGVATLHRIGASARF
jgi:DNA invertase Pin-like site-specific DNA recombinase